jgi:hypothetical protein
MNWKEVKNAVGSMEVRYGLCGGGKIGLLFYRLRGCGLGRGTDKWTHLVWFFNSSFFAFLVWFFNSSFFSVQPRCVGETSPRGSQICAAAVPWVLRLRQVMGAGSVWSN